MTTFPGDMNIGLGFGVPEDESLPPFQLTDPLLAVSELEQRVNDLEERFRNLTGVTNVLINQTHQLVHDEGRIDGQTAILSSLVGKVNDLVERLRTLTIIINGQVDSIELLFDQQNSQNERLNSIEQLLSTWTQK